MSTSIPSRYRYEPANMAAALIFAKAVVKSGLAPNVQTVEKAFVILATGAELGLTAMQSLRSIHIIDGKPSLSADLIVGLIKSSPVCKWFRMVESTPTEAVYETQRHGEPEPSDYTFKIEDAKRAGLTGRANWRKHPAAMLRARCSSALGRAVYPDVVGGLYCEGELEDTPQAPTPAQPPERIERPAYLPAPPAVLEDETPAHILNPRIQFTHDQEPLDVQTKPPGPVIPRIDFDRLDEDRLAAPLPKGWSSAHLLTIVGPAGEDTAQDFDCLESRGKAIRAATMHRASNLAGAIEVGNWVDFLHRSEAASIAAWFNEEYTRKVVLEERPLSDPVDPAIWQRFHEELSEHDLGQAAVSARLGLSRHYSRLPDPIKASAMAIDSAVARLVGPEKKRGGAFVAYLAARLATRARIKQTDSTEATQVRKDGKPTGVWTFADGKTIELSDYEWAARTLLATAGLEKGIKIPLVRWLVQCVAETAKSYTDSGVSELVDAALEYVGATRERITREQTARAVVAIRRNRL